jgi:TonB family protein
MLRIAFAVAMALVVAATPASAQDTNAAAAAVPLLQNAEALEARIRDAYPAPLRELEVEAIATLAVRVDAEGAADSVRLVVSTGVPGLDNAVLNQIALARWEPAIHEGVPGPAWTTLHAFVHPTRAAVLEEAPEPLRAANRAQVEARARALLPDEFRNANVGADVLVAVIVDGTGSPRSQVLVQQNCLTPVLQAGLAATALLRFEPTTGSAEDRHVALVTVMFAASSARIRVQGVNAPEDTTRAVARPEDTGSIRAPQLRNRLDVQRSLERSYPPDLRAAGIGGEPVVWVFVDDRGNVTRRQIHQGSGHCALDLAALQVAAAMRFSPAMNNGAPVPVWVSIPIVFRAY